MHEMEQRTHNKPLTARQRELLERVCLKRYTVRLHHYAGRFNPNEYVTVSVDADAIWDRSFRPSTLESLRKRGLVSYRHEVTTSTILPTEAGLGEFRKTRGS